MPATVQATPMPAAAPELTPLLPEPEVAAGAVAGVVAGVAGVAVSAFRYAMPSNACLVLAP